MVTEKKIGFFLMTFLYSLSLLNMISQKKKKRKKKSIKPTFFILLLIFLSQNVYIPRPYVIDKLTFVTSQIKGDLR